MGMMIPVQINGSIYRINPLFNLRFFFPALVEQVLKGLKEAVWEDWFKDYLRAADVTEEDLMEAWRCYSRYMEASLSTTDQETPRDAMEQSGFMACKKEARLVVLAKIGQIFTAAVWWPLREGTEVDKIPEDLVKLSVTADNVFGRLTK